METGPEPVVLTIGQPGRETSHGSSSTAGAHAPVPGGFAKFFNRVIDGGQWSRLPEAARAVYMPLVRFADGRDGFRVRIGLAALMRYAGLSRSSVKRGLRALQEARLLVVVRAGGVAPDGTNRTNLYQLLMPDGDAENCTELLGPAAAAQSASRAKRGPRQRAAEVRAGPASADTTYAEVARSAPPISRLISLNSWSDDLPPRGPDPNPLPGHSWSAAPVAAEPPARPPPAPGAGRPANPAGGPGAAGTGAAAGLLHRHSLRSQTSEVHAAAGDADVEMSPEGLPRASDADRQAAVALLRAWGVEPSMARELAAAHAATEVSAAVAMARQAKARGRLRNPAGFIVRCLDESWADMDTCETAAPVADANQREAMEQARRRDEAERAAAARAAVDAQIDSLDDETLAFLADRVLESHAARPAMIRLLRAKPPRESRLMRAEVAALLELETTEASDVEN